MDTSIVIPLGKGSRWNDIELRYCLRSIEKHLIGHGDIFLIGEKPLFLNDKIIHIPCPDYGDKTYDKERNIYTKIMAACTDDRVSKDFLFMNDDHFLLQGYEPGEFPYYYEGRLRDKLTVTDYKHTINNTTNIIGPNVLYTDIHCPIVYKKEAFSKLSRYNWQLNYGYCIKTVYCYEHVLGGHLRQYNDLKINEALPASKIRQLLTGRPWFSIGDKAFNGGIRHVLQDLYPHKSKYE